MSGDPEPEIVPVTPKRTSICHAWITSDVLELLNLNAELLRQHPDRLAADILTAVLNRGLVAAVLEG